MKKIHSFLLLIITSLFTGLFLVSGVAFAEPSIACSDTTHKVFTSIDDAKKELTINCQSADGASYSDANVSTGTDMQVTCAEGATPTTTEVQKVGKKGQKVTCSSTITSYFNGDSVVQTSETGSSTADARKDWNSDFKVECDSDTSSGEELNSSNCGIISYLVKGINFLSALAGMAIVASMIIAGFQYMTARDNSHQIEAAKKRIIWAIVSLIIFMFMYGFLNFIVPGGVI